PSPSRARSPTGGPPNGPPACARRAALRVPSRATPTRDRRVAGGATRRPGASSAGSEAQMTEREEAIVRVFAVEHVVFPVAVEPAAVRPERIDEVEARLLERRDVLVEAHQGVERGRGRQQIG